MATYRNNELTWEEYEKKINRIKEVLAENSFEFNKVIVESAVYDTNQEHDSSWLCSLCGKCNS